MTEPVRWGPDNLHPLSKMKTELVWDGKYDEYGLRRPVDVAGSAMPMQKIETVDMPRSEALAGGQTTLGELKTTRQYDFRNMLIWGDNKLVMASLLKDFRGKIDLIYIDPPFDVGADFTMQVPIGGEKGAVEKDQSLLEMVAYRDMWGKGSDSYLQMIYERLTLMKDLLSETVMPGQAPMRHENVGLGLYPGMIISLNYETGNQRRSVSGGFISPRE